VDDAKVRQSCDDAMKKATGKDCGCVLIVPTDGKVPMSQKEFVTRIFDYHYRLINTYLLSGQSRSRAGELVQLRRSLQLSEQAHYQRLEAAGSAPRRD